MMAYLIPDELYVLLIHGGYKAQQRWAGSRNFAFMYEKFFSSKASRATLELSSSKCHTFLSLVNQYSQLRAH